MKNDLHLTVGVVVTNNERDVFYLQQRDETYWIPEFRLNYAFFSGALECGENEIMTLKRELREELEESVANLIYKNSKKLFDYYLENIFKQKCKFSLYEAVILNKELKKISKLPIKEGKIGVLIQKRDVLKISFVSDLKGILIKYLMLNVKD